MFFVVALWQWKPAQVVTRIRGNTSNSESSVKLLNDIKRTTVRLWYAVQCSEECRVFKRWLCILTPVPD